MRAQLKPNGMTRKEIISMDVFINDIAAFLPNDPVENDAIEDVLGKVNDISSRAKRIVLKNNKITRRYYAIDPKSGQLTHTNAQLTAEAIRRLRPYAGFSPEDIECICCGTTGPDLLFPGHALMVLGELGIPECDAVSTAGICISGMTAFKHAFMNVAMGMSNNAVATGSELASSFMRASFFQTSKPDTEKDIEKRPVLAFDEDFLRWMLSDGAGAVFLSPEPNRDRISLRVDWIEHVSFAGQIDTCMFAGGVKRDDGSVTGWRETEKLDPDDRLNILAVKQDIRLLDKHIVPTMVRALTRTVKKHHMNPADVDWFLPHYSSAYFRDKFYQGMKEAGFEVPYERWFTNLATTGNTGSAAIYIIMEELFRSGNLKAGETIFCFIPESGRFSHCFMCLTVVE